MRLLKPIRIGIAASSLIASSAFADPNSVIAGRLTQGISTNTVPLTQAITEAIQSIHIMATPGTAEYTTIQGQVADLKDAWTAMADDGVLTSVQTAEIYMLAGESDVPHTQVVFQIYPPSAADPGADGSDGLHTMTAWQHGQTVGTDQFTMTATDGSQSALFGVQLVATPAILGRDPDGGLFTASTSLMGAVLTDTQDFMSITQSPNTPSDWAFALNQNPNNSTAGLMTQVYSQFAVTGDLGQALTNVKTIFPDLTDTVNSAFPPEITSDPLTFQRAVEVLSTLASQNAAAVVTQPDAAQLNGNLLNTQQTDGTVPTVTATTDPTTLATNVNTNLDALSGGLAVTPADVQAAGQADDLNQLIFQGGVLLGNPFIAAVGLANIDPSEYAGASWQDIATTFLNPVQTVLDMYSSTPGELITSASQGIFGVGQDLLDNLGSYFTLANYGQVTDPLPTDPSTGLPSFQYLGSTFGLDSGANLLPQDPFTGVSSLGNSAGFSYLAGSQAAQISPLDFATQAVLGDPFSGTNNSVLFSAINDLSNVNTVVPANYGPNVIDLMPSLQPSFNFLGDSGLINVNSIPVINPIEFQLPTDLPTILLPAIDDTNWDDNSLLYGATNSLSDLAAQNAAAMTLLGITNFSSVTNYDSYGNLTNYNIIEQGTNDPTAFGTGYDSGVGSEDNSDFMGDFGDWD